MTKNPNLTPEQQVNLLIRLVMGFYREKTFVDWCERWLDKTDRTRSSAEDMRDEQNIHLQNLLSLEIVGDVGDNLLKNKRVYHASVAADSAVKLALKKKIDVWNDIDNILKDIGNYNYTKELELAQKDLVEEVLQLRWKD